MDALKCLLAKPKSLLCLTKINAVDTASNDVVETVLTYLLSLSGNAGMATALNVSCAMGAFRHDDRFRYSLLMAFQATYLSP